MRVETNEKEYCKVEVNYWADPEVIEEKITEAVEALRKTKVPGFRAGKAPDYAIKQRCKKQIQNWVASQMSIQAYDDILFETDIKPIGQAKLEKVEFKDKDYFCKMTFLKKPSFELGKYLELEVPKPDVNRDVVGMTEGSLMALRVRLGDLNPYGEDDLVSIGDKITLSSKASIDGEVFEDGTFEGMLYRVGDAQFPEFDNFIVGMKADETREFELVFPDEVPNVGGKTAKFEVTVHMGMKLVPHEINEEFLQKCGVNNIIELQEKLRSITNARIKDSELGAIKNQVAKQLVANHDFQIPEFLIDSEVKSIANHYEHSSGVPLECLPDDLKEEFTKKATESIRLTLVLDAIKEQEPEAVLSDNEAYQILAGKIQVQGNDPKKMLDQAQKNGMLFGMIASLKNDFVLEWLASKVKIVE